MQLSLFDTIESGYGFEQDLKLNDPDDFHFFSYYNSSCYRYVKATNHYQVVEQTELVNGLRTFVGFHVLQGVGYKYASVYEAVTGVALYYNTDGRNKRELILKAHQEAYKQTKELDKKYGIERVLKATHSITNGISPQFSGNRKRIQCEPTDLEKGEEIIKIEIRGGLKLYEGVVTDIVENHRKRKEATLLMGGTNRGWKSSFELDRPYKSIETHFLFRKSDFMNIWKA